MEASAAPVCRAGEGGEEQPHQVRHQAASERFDQPDQQRRDEGAAHAADAADDDDDEGQDQHRVAHAGFHGKDRRGHDAREPRQHGATAEHQHEQAVDIDAERRDHGRIAGAGAYQGAEAGALHHQPQQPGGGQARQQDGGAIGRPGQAGHQLDAAFQQRRHRHLQRRAAPDHADQLVQAEDDAEGGQHLCQVVARIEVAEHQPFQRQAGQQRHRQRQQQRKPEAAGGRGEAGAQIGAQHVLHAMRQVDEVHHPEHQRQPRRHQEQQDAELQPVQRLDQKKLCAHPTSCRRWRRGRCRSPAPCARSRWRTCRRRA